MQKVSNAKLKKLKRLSKDDLIWIISRMSSFGQEYFLDEAILSLEYKKEKEKLDKADEINEKAYQHLMEYIDLMSPYGGKKISEIPLDILEKASKAIEQAKKLDDQWNRLMGI